MHIGKTSMHEHSRIYRVYRVCTDVDAIFTKLPWRWGQYYLMKLIHFYESYPLGYVK